MKLTRRAFLGAAVATPALAAAAEPAGRLGIVIHSFGIRAGQERGFSDPLVFLEHCRQLGAGGVQVPIGARPPEYTAKLREHVEKHGLYLEGSIRIPKDRGDVDRFEAEVRCAHDAGAKVLRTVSSPGRRYETFHSATAFREWAEQATRSLQLAEAVVGRHHMRLAVENHKDWRVEEQVALLKKLDSPHVGVCVDTGNNIALLEEPLETVQALAPWAYSVHLKDMAVAEYEGGFLLSEVPLGEGFLDLPKVVNTLRQARPEVRFNLEMITRNPLKVPCLQDGYWATFESLPGRQLARALALVRRRQPKTPLPRMDGMSKEEQVAREEENVRKSIAFARENLKL